MKRYILHRLLLTVVLAFCAASLVFGLLHAVPGDPVRIFMGEFATDDQIAVVRRQMGLDRPLAVQYVNWLGGMVRGDLGDSLMLKVPVRELIMDRLPRTFELVATSICLGLLIGLPIGIISALHRGKGLDLGLTASTLLTLSIPNYVVGTVLVLLLAVRLKWFSASGYVAFSDDPVSHIKLLILPCLTLGSHLAASVARFTRSSVLEVMALDYVRTARSKGLSERRVLRSHILRNGLLPVTTIVGLQAGNLLGGTVIVEAIFAWPGLSTLLFQGINTHDYPVVQGTVLVIAVLFIFLNLFVDILNGIIDPRASLETES